MERSYASPFKCVCGHENRNPLVSSTEGGTDVAICDGCGLKVSRRLIADLNQRRDMQREASLMRWAGWE